jgi:small subunit ribosomal protein S6
MAVTPNYYETLYIARPDIQEEDLAKIQQKLQDSISAHQGDIIKAEKWAERGLAYEIQDHKRGIYYILLFKALPSACAEIEKHLSFYNTDILRFITLKITEEAVNKQKAAQEKAAEKAEAQKAESAKEAAAEVAEEVAQEVVPEAQKAESTEEAAAEVVEEVAQEVVPETQQAESAEEPVAEAAEEVAQEVVPETQQAESAEEPAAEVTEEEGGTK